MRLLCLTRYDRSGASSRLRFYQFQHYLEAQGIVVHLSPLLPPYYLRNLYSFGKRPIKAIIGGYFRRALGLICINQYDLLWIEKELFPWLPFVEDLFFDLIRCPYVVDYDDAVFHLYDEHSNRLVRSVLGTKHDAIMSKARAVTVGSQYLANRAKRAGAKDIFTVPTVVDMSRYDIGKRNTHDFTIGWVGTPITEKYLEIVRKAIERIAAAATVRVRLVGASTKPLNSLHPEILKWSEQTEVDLISTFDVGIMPLFDNSFERGKCGYKIIQYMACGLPVIASPVGANNSIIDHGTTGFLANSEEEWFQYLNILRCDKELREHMGANAKAKAQKYYSLSVVAPMIHRIIVGAMAV